MKVSEKADEPLVVIDRLSKRFDTTLALDQIQATLERGRILGLVGPDGAGKTTLIRLMAGLLKPDTGTITVNGLDTIKQGEKIHSVIGYMPQRFGLYEDLTVMQNLNLYADLRLIDREKRGEIFEKLLAFTGLKPFVERFAKDLSGGMKQKLGLACALIKKPILLLLDEPSVGVDPLSRRELWKMVHSLVEEGVTVVWSTSYLDEAENCHDTLLLNNGKLLFKGPPNKLTERVQGRTFVVEGIEENRRESLNLLLPQKNVLDGVIQGKNLRLVTREKLDPPFDLSVFKNGEKLKLTPTPPRFEDAYIDVVGEKPLALSELAKNTPEIPFSEGYKVEARHLCKKFGAFTAVSDISFELKRGEIFGLLGPNGAGKSTTFKMLCGLLKPTSGESFVNGLPLQSSTGEARSHLGYMAQKFSLYGGLSVEQNLNYFAGIYNLKGAEKKEQINEMVSLFDLKPYLNASADSLPLGFKQRLALSCALMHHPSVLFLDEPTSGVDPITRREFWNHINGLVQKGVTILVTTHFMDEAEYCDRIALIYRSRMISMGDPDTLKNLARSEKCPQPTLEETFIELIERYNEENPL